MPPTTGYQCCFCGEGVEEDPQVLSLAMPDDGWQQLYCHERCLRRVMHPSVPLGLPAGSDAQDTSR